MSLVKKSMMTLAVGALCAACGSSRDTPLTDDQKKQLFATLHSAQTLGDGVSKVNKAQTPAEQKRGTRHLSALVQESALGSFAASIHAIPEATPSEQDGGQQGGVTPDEAEQIGYNLNEAKCEMVDKGIYSSKMGHIDHGSFSSNQPSMPGFPGDSSPSLNGSSPAMPKAGDALIDMTVNGATCPIKASIKVVLDEINMNSGTGKLSFAGSYSALSDDFKKLVDITDMTLAGTASGGQSEGEIEAAANLTSKARGLIRIGLDFTGDSAKDGSQSVDGTMKIVQAGYTAKITMTQKRSANGDTVETYQLNGEPITKEELQKRIRQGS